MRKTRWIALGIGVVVAAVCIRLGFWQLDRREQRAMHNAMVEANAAAAPVPLPRLAMPDESLHYRRVLVRGRWDYNHEIALTGRTRNGAPGVHIFTPLVPNGIEQAILVNRGWVYSPDAASVTFEDWREGDTASFVGFVEFFPPHDPDAGDPRSTRSPRSWHRLDTTELSKMLPYRLEPYYVVALPDSDRASPTPPGRPARLELPQLGAGPHLSYAIQWFSFAAIALIGAGVLAFRDRDAVKAKRD
jgi:surfeit locus 1 family protein